VESSGGGFDAGGGWRQVSHYLTEFQCQE
jgi:hypothetical protein